MLALFDALELPDFLPVVLDPVAAVVLPPLVAAAEPLKDPDDCEPVELTDGEFEEEPLVAVDCVGC